MAKPVQTASCNDQTLDSCPAINPSTTSSHTHADFIEIRARTAKCDSCDKHNNLTVYRCVGCGQHVCSPCWNKSEKKTCASGNGSRDGSESTSHGKIEADDAHGDNGNKDAKMTRAVRRVHVISNEANTKAANAVKQDQDSANVTSDNDHYYDHETLPVLWPMTPGSGPPVLKPADPNTSTSAPASVNRMTQRAPRDRVEGKNLGHHRFRRDHDQLGRQTASSRAAYIDDQVTNPNFLPAQRYIPNPLMNCSAPHHVQPAIYRPRPGINVDQQAAHVRFPSTNDPSSNYQISPSGHNSVMWQQVGRPAPFLPHDSIFTSQRHVQTTANMDQAAIRDQKVARFQKAQADAAAKRLEAHNQHISGVNRNALLAGNRDQLIAHNQRAFISNHLSPSAAGHEQMLSARDQHRSYLKRPPADYPTSALAQASFPYAVATETFRPQFRPVFAQQHEAIFASHQGQYSQPIRDHPNGPSPRIGVRQVCLQGPA